MLYNRILCILVLSDFYEVPLVKQYITHIFSNCIFNQYLTNYGEIPKVVLDKIYTPIQSKKYNLNNNNFHNEIMLSMRNNNIFIN